MAAPTPSRVACFVPLVTSSAAYRFHLPGLRILGKFPTGWGNAPLARPAPKVGGVEHGSIASRHERERLSIEAVVKVSERVGRTPAQAPSKHDTVT